MTAAKPQAQRPGAACTQSTPLPPWGPRHPARCWPRSVSRGLGDTGVHSPYNLPPLGPTREGWEGRTQSQTRSPGSVGLLRAASPRLVPKSHLVPGACSQKVVLEREMQTQGRWSCDRAVTRLSPRGPGGEGSTGGSCALSVPAATLLGTCSSPWTSRLAGSWGL